MLQRIIERIEGGYCLAVVAIGIGIVSVMGCATDSPKPAPTITQEQVKSNADKSFERLKQEEKNHAVGSGPAPY